MSEREEVESLARAIADVEVMEHPTLGVPVFLSHEQAEHVATAALSWFRARQTVETAEEGGFGKLADRRRISPMWTIAVSDMGSADGMDRCERRFEVAVEGMVEEGR